jgi:hypothetical protein
MIRIASSALRRRSWAFAAATPVLLTLSTSLHAQAAKDSARADTAHTTRAQRLERIMI